MGVEGATILITVGFSFVFPHPALSVFLYDSRILPKPTLTMGCGGNEHDMCPGGHPPRPQ